QPGTGGLTYGLLTVDRSEVTTDAAPFALGQGGVGGKVTINARLDIGGVQVLPTGTTFTVGAKGDLRKAGKAIAAITGEGLLTNNGVIATDIEVTATNVAGTTRTVTFNPPGGTTVTKTIFGTSLDAVGLEFPEIVVADDEYVRWGTTPSGGSRIGTATVLAEGITALYPVVLKKGVALAGSLAELQAELATFGTGEGQSTTIRLSDDIAAPAGSLTVPAGSNGKEPLVLDLGGHDLSLDSIVVAPGALTIKDTTSTTSDPGGTLTVAPSEEGPAGPGVRLAGASTLKVASGRLSVTASPHQPGIGAASGDTAAGSVVVTGGALTALAEEPGSTAIGGLEDGVLGTFEVRGGRAVVRGLSTDRTSVTIGANGVLEVAVANEIRVRGIDGSATVTNDGVILGDLAGVKAPVAPNNAIVTFDVGAGALPDGVAGSPRIYAATLTAGGRELPTPTRPGYTFDGWYVGDEVFTATTTLPSATSIDGRVSPGARTVTARWTPISAEVSDLTGLKEAIAAPTGLIKLIGPLVTDEVIDFGDTESVLDLNGQEVTLAGVKLGAALTVRGGTLGVTGASKLGDYRLTVASTATIVGSRNASIEGNLGSVLQVEGAVKVPFVEATKYRGLVFSVAPAGTIDGTLVTAGSFDGAGATFPAGPVVEGKKFLGWTTTENPGTTPTYVTATSGLGAGSTTDGQATTVTLYPQYADRPPITEVSSAAELAEALTCGGGITAPVSIKLAGPATLTDAVSGTCAASIDLNGRALTLGDLTAAGDLTIAGGTLTVTGTLGLGTHTLTVGEGGTLASTGKGSVTADTGGIVNNGAITIPTAALPTSIKGRNYALTFDLAGATGEAPADVRALADSVAAGGSVLPIPTWAGFTFAGWFTAATGGTQVTAATGLSSLTTKTSVDGTPVPVSLFAQWTAVPVVVPPGGDGGGGAPTPTPTPDPEPELPLPPTAPPSVVGRPVVGGTLAAVVELPAVAGASAAYQWQVVLADGTLLDIAGADSAEYLVPAEYAGLELQLVVTITAPGYETRVATYRFPGGAGEVQLGSLLRERPMIVGLRGGIPVTGRKLRLDVGVVATAATSARVAPGVPGLKVRVRWLADGVPIRGASRRVFRPGAGQLGKALSVRVTLRAPGYVMSRSTSKATKPVVLGKSLLAPAKVMVGKRAPLVVKSPPAAASYRLMVGSVEIAAGRVGHPGAVWTRSPLIPTFLSCGIARFRLAWLDRRGRVIARDGTRARLTGC
ncbi:MAG: hypothetical protein F2667_07210, partial [Actinobacteria bacterium]|nr:hypothetical protein [Actinomycetota bacterium]